MIVRTCRSISIIFSLAPQKNGPKLASKEKNTKIVPILVIEIKSQKMCFFRICFIVCHFLPYSFQLVLATASWICKKICSRIPKSRGTMKIVPKILKFTEMLVKNNFLSFLMIKKCYFKTFPYVLKCFEC